MRAAQRTAGGGRNTGMRKALAALWLVVYALVAVAVPVAEATASHAPVEAHWEDANDSSCPPRHDASTCQLCQAGGASGLLPGRGFRLPGAEPPARAEHPAPLRVDAPAPPRGTPPSRAPPVT